MAKGKKKALPVSIAEPDLSRQLRSSSLLHAKLALIGPSQRSRSRGDPFGLGSNDVPDILNNFDRGCKELFIVGKKSQKPSAHLLTLKQGNRESPKDFISRFNEEALQVDNYNDKMALSTMISSLKEGRFLFSIGKNPPTTLTKLISRAQKYTNTEEFFSLRKNSQTAESSKGKRQRDDTLQQVDKRRLDDNTIQDRRSSRKPERKFHTYTPLDTSPEQILLVIRDQRLLHWLSCMKTDADHNTSDCVDLKDEIETLICKGHLRQYMKEEKQAQKDDQPRRAEEEATEIQTIYGGPSGGGDLNQAYKAYSRSTDPEHYIHLAKRLRKELRVNPCSLTFMEDDAWGIQHPHDDTLVVVMTIANRKVYRILVDIGCSTDILYSKAFDKMGIDRSRLQPVKTPLHEFVGDKVIFKGAIFLPVTLLVDFLVVNVPSMHNVILGQSFLNAMRAVVSMYHLMIKFLANGGVGYVQGDQREARRCYSIAVRKGSAKQALIINMLDPRDSAEDSLTKDLVTVLLKDADPSRIV
ncbi:uncharacterized protein LOC131247107 [Magnolia sinica]|uniref:uncharacterized protein LOC131247107 n=1 Tax=Magnolia sinica TaxID=86752 RepID=UPI00265947D8|nr:uncharacterized protein LOC131247107 [Magnolia sinica]